MSFSFPFSGPLPLRLIEQPINAVLDSDPATRQRLDVHAGRSIGLRVEDLRLEFVLNIQQHRVCVTQDGVESADCYLQASSVVFMQLAMQPGNRSLLFGQRMSVHGDTALAGAIADCLGDLQVDAGALFSPLLGDVAGQGLGQLLSQATGWLRRTGSHLRMDVEEYLENESGLPNQREGDGLFRAITETREAVERLEARLHRIRRQIAPAGESVR